MPEISADQAAAGIGWFTTQAGIAATVLAIVAVTFAAGLVMLYRSGAKQMEAAWARVTVISDARQSDARDMAKAVSDNTVALARVAERVDLSDRRSR